MNLGSGLGRALRRRPRLLGALAALTLGLGLWFWPQGRPATPAASAEDCVDLTIWTNDFHTDFEFDARILPEDHPLRRLYPWAQRLQVGWGDEAFYRSPGTDMALGAKALLPGGAVIMHVIASPGPPVEAFFWPSATSQVRLSARGAAELAQFLKDTLVLDAAGAPQVLGEGKMPELSVFLRAKGDFHLLRVCNHWTAEGLRRAGVAVQSRWAWYGRGLTEAAGRLAPGPCR